MITARIHLKRLSHDRRETSRKTAESEDERVKETTDFHQNRLPNQMGTL